MNTSYSRIKHHSITSTASFSVPVSNNFTDGTWASTDLVTNEIGVNEANQSVWIRIGNDIYQIITDNANNFSQYIDVFSGLVGNSATASEVVLYQKDIPANYFNDQTGFNIKAGLRSDADNDPKEFSLKVGGQTIYTSTADNAAPNDGRHNIEFQFIRTGTSSTATANVTGSAQTTYGGGTSSLYDLNVGVGITATYSWGATISVQITASASKVNDIELSTTTIYDIR
jgi:hypothetical protein